ncbi:ribosome biogenesis GTPase Der [Patescibacteria group bacterium]|jgi:GTP-binding protein|nr:ribosome biogenesis GTPase Der [Patescibacteria group bacterium]
MPHKRNRDLPIVAVVGRTNVGKSTLWNKLTESGRAVVSKEEHTTRDRNFGRVLWKGASFLLVDTGGMDTQSDEIGEGIRRQAELAIHDADLVLFVVDAQMGVMPQDLELARLVQKAKKPVWLVANKVDTLKYLPQASDASLYRLNLGEPQAVSAATGLGVGDLLDSVYVELDRLGKPPLPAEDAEGLKLVLVGRPNVGKSSLVNAILGEERVIVSAIAHTTREPQDTEFEYEGKNVVIVDTAGMRQRSKITKGVEEAGIERNMGAVHRADVALLVFDATQDPTSQDRHLAGMLEESHKGLILVANKWDLAEDKDSNSAKRYEALIRQLFPFLDWAPMVFVSAKTGLRAAGLVETAFKVQEERYRHIDYNAVNRLLKATIKKMKPLASYGPKSPRIFDAAQISHAPPTFLITVHGDKENLHPNWLKFFEKRLREKFHFTGTPIVVKVRHLPLAKTIKKHNIQGPGMEAVAGKIREKKKLVNQTMRRQKHGGRRY